MGESLKCCLVNCHIHFCHGEILVQSEFFFKVQITLNFFIKLHSNHNFDNKGPVKLNIIG